MIEKILKWGKFHEDQLVAVFAPNERGLSGIAGCVEKVGRLVHRWHWSINPGISDMIVYNYGSERTELEARRRVLSELQAYMSTPFLIAEYEDEPVVTDIVRVQFDKDGNVVSTSVSFDPGDENSGVPKKST